MATASRANRRSGRSGFSLLEVMIALSILAVGLLTLSAMQMQALAAGRNGKTDAFAMTLSQDKMEDLRRRAWTDGQLASTGNWVTPETVTNAADGQTYVRDWRVDDIVVDWTKSLDVRVRWSTPGKPNRSRILSSIRYNREDL
jgi:prepilin-type N-terminal cleavage/methylation domain-containing protein